MHNRIVYIANEIIEIEKRDADDLLKLNLVKVINSDVLRKSNKLTNQDKPRRTRSKSHQNNIFK
jgi:hypothetical protein